MENDILHPNLKNEETLEERFARERKEWDAKVAELSSKMNKLVELPSLMTTLYTSGFRRMRKNTSVCCPTFSILKYIIEQSKLSGIPVYRTM